MSRLHPSSANTLSIILFQATQVDCLLSKAATSAGSTKIGFVLCRTRWACLITIYCLELMPSADNYEFHSKRFRRKKGEEHYANHRHQPWKRAPVLSWTLMKPKLFKWKILSINQPRNWRWSEWVWRLCNVVRIARKCSAKRLKVAYFQDPCSKGDARQKNSRASCWGMLTAPTSAVFHEKRADIRVPNIGSFFRRSFFH